MSDEFLVVTSFGIYHYDYDMCAERILGFHTPEHHFLSNFEPASLTFGGTYFPTGEHMYQFYKSADPAYRKMILEAQTPGQAKRLASRLGDKAGAFSVGGWGDQQRVIERVAGWDQDKCRVMYAALVCKFTQNPDMMRKLIATGGSYIEETNTWGDKFWGVCDGDGENALGKLLMSVRTTFRAIE